MNRGNLDTVKHRQKTMGRHTGRRWPSDWSNNASIRKNNNNNKKMLRIAGKHQKLEEGRKDSLSELSARAWDRGHLDFSSQNCKKIYFCCFRLPHFWYIIMTNLGNKYRNYWHYWYMDFSMVYQLSNERRIFSNNSFLSPEIGGETDK